MQRHARTGTFPRNHRAPCAPELRGRPGGARDAEEGSAQLGSAPKGPSVWLRTSGLIQQEMGRTEGSRAGGHLRGSQRKKELLSSLHTGHWKEGRRTLAQDRMRFPGELFQMCCTPCLPLALPTVLPWPWCPGELPMIDFEATDMEQGQPAMKVGGWELTPLIVTTHHALPTVLGRLDPVEQPWR